MLRIILALFMVSFVIPAHAAPANPQIVCIAQTMYHEARGEPEKGIIAVGNVIVNRTKSGKFPTTPCAVVKQKSKTSCQFSWVCARASVKDQNLYRKVMMLATYVYYNKVNDNTNGSLYFHAKSVRPNWSGKRYAVTIGNHIFYRG